MRNLSLPHTNHHMESFISPRRTADVDVLRGISNAILTWPRCLRGWTHGFPPS